MDKKFKQQRYIYTLHLKTIDGKIRHSGCFSTREKALDFARIVKENNGAEVDTIYRDVLQ